MQMTATTLSRIGQIAMPARDIDRAVAFYRDTLGIRFLFTAPPGMAFFDCGGVRLLLGTSEPGKAEHPGSILYYVTEDIEGTHAGLAARGVRFIREPHLVARLPDHDLWLAFFEDSEGNTLALMEERRGVSLEA
jgi:methylmalonyl-CoA/ethylmalonyl-CoA epimerase